MAHPITLTGLAYFCRVEGCPGLTGRLITKDRQQYSIKGTTHHHGQEDDHSDHHTCCYDDSVEILDLTVSQLSDLSEDLVFSHVIKSAEDNFSLTSDSVSFYTDKLIVDEEADLFVAKYFTPDLVGKDCYISIGKIVLGSLKSQAKD